MSRPQTKPQLAKSLMDLALSQEGAVEYTSLPGFIQSLRIECYKTRSMMKHLQDDSYNELKFHVRFKDGMTTLTIARN